jgi:hypothetical protein
VIAFDVRNARAGLFRADKIGLFPTEKFGPFLETFFRAFRAVMLCPFPWREADTARWPLRANRERRTVSQLVRLLLRDVLASAAR